MSYNELYSSDRENRMVVKEFIKFIREQGVIGLAVGFVLGGSITKVVASVVTDLVNPVIGILLGAVGNLTDLYWQVGGAKITYGRFLANLIDFVTVAAVVFIAVRLLKLDALDKKKDKKPQEVVIVQPTPEIQPESKTATYSNKTPLKK